jgi:hypothetical protein
MNNLKTTGVGDIELPFEFVELNGRALRRKDGAPLVVRCEFIEEEKLIGIIESAPGHSPDLGIKESEPSIETARALLKYAPGLLSASCALVNGDAVQFPAFHFGNDDPNDGSLPAKFLSTPDKLKLVVAILKVCGFFGGAADDLRFHGRVGARSDASVGDLGVSEGNGNATVDSLAGIETS